MGSTSSALVSKKKKQENIKQVTSFFIRNKFILTGLYKLSFLLL